MHLMCINNGLGHYVPSALVNTNQIHVPHSYMCYNNYLTPNVRTLVAVLSFVKNRTGKVYLMNVVNVLVLSKIIPSILLEFSHWTAVVDEV